MIDLNAKITTAGHPGLVDSSIPLRISGLPFLPRLRERLDRDANVRFAVIFGSYARGGTRAGSDLDLAVYFNQPPVGLDHLDLLSELSDLAGREVDLVVLNRASALLRRQVFKNRIPLCIKDQPSYTAFRVKAMADYDTYRYLAGGRARD